MPVNYNYKLGVDMPSWHWLTPFPNGPSYHGTSCAYDNRRYIYWAIQYGTTATTASTSQLWRYDTWSNGWQYLATLTSSNRGIDLEYDPVRNIIWITHGTLTEWRFFNLNLVPVTIFGVSTAGMSLSAAITTPLPVAAGTGASTSMINDLELSAQFDSGTVTTGSTASTLISTAPKASFQGGIVGLQIRFTSGTLAGQARVITAVNSSSSITVTRAFSAAPANGDSYVVELPSDTTVSGTTTTLVTNGGLPVNAYANADVVVGGQRRRIASNDATTLTLAAAVAGNARTGPFATAPTSGQTYTIMPSSDFFYYIPAGAASQAAYKIDVVATTAAWVALTNVPTVPGGGANLMHPAHSSPFQLLFIRGNATNTMYRYDPGTNAWIQLASFMGSETFGEGASSAIMSDRRKIAIQKEGSARIYSYDVITGELEPAGYMPYANPGAYEGHRMKFITAPSGVAWIYLMRAGGQEFYRVPIEWV